MTEEKAGQQEPTTPYDLWPPNTTEPMEGVEPILVVPQKDPVGPSVAGQPPIPYDVPFGGVEDRFEAPFEVPFVPIEYTPETTEESVRQRGLAFSIGVVFFSSVAFMLFLGWLADLILGSSPWGIVVGIMLGAAIGFLQFFRITSQIFKNDRNLPKENPLLSRDDDSE